MSAALHAGRHLDNATLELWKHLVEAGGYWTLREIRHTWFAAADADTVRDMVQRLRDNGMVRPQRPARRNAAHAYGVTVSCQAPPGFDYLMGRPT